MQVITFQKIVINIRDMKKKILLIAMFYVTFISAQDLKKIENQNTFFILFDSCELTKKTNISRKDNPSFNYYYFYKKNGLIETFKFSFNYSKYLSYDDAINKSNQAKLFRINKSFLRKNKDIIITRDFMEKIGFKKMINLIDGDLLNRTIFLINTEDTKNGKILIREVTINYEEEI